ncbi:hypothetical protein [Phenylobacterium sp.]|uniref:hypothetical protein n=1 Tax=Phenylobacterium sp. TaxID=1871053 RepID=UPI0025F928AE|nr:hypothetical protein [Phenylobacterium sp.]
MVRIAATILALAFLPAPALAQAQAAPRPSPPGPVLDWPWPDPDPKSWWDDKRPKPDETADPLGGRRPSRGERPLIVANGYDPLLYRLWGLPPLQNQVLRSGELIIEVAVRPATSTRQTLVRAIVRRDGKAFIQARAGLGCCEPGIARRVGFDVEAPPDAAARLTALAQDPLWSSPREVRVVESSGAADALCVDGTSYDLTLAQPGQVRAVRRACDSAEIGQAADVLETVLGLALGHEPRIDVIYPGGADYSAARTAYRDLIAAGGMLKPSPNARAQPPSFAEPPPPEDEPAAPPSPSAER